MSFPNFKDTFLDLSWLIPNIYRKNMKIQNSKNLSLTVPNVLGNLLLNNKLSKP